MTTTSPTGAGGVALSEWLKRIGRSKITGIRWKAAGIISPSVNINGQDYMTDEDIARFWQRAQAGDFRKESVGICAKEEEA